MSRFTVQRFDTEGRPSTFLEGRELRHYTDTDTLEIDELRLRHVDREGRLVHAVAQRGLAHGDGSEVQLFGGAGKAQVTGCSFEALQGGHGGHQAFGHSVLCGSNHYLTE